MLKYRGVNYPAQRNTARKSRHLIFALSKPRPSLTPLRPQLYSCRRKWCLRNTQIPSQPARQAENRKEDVCRDNSVIFCPVSLFPFVSGKVVSHTYSLGEPSSSIHMVLVLNSSSHVCPRSHDPSPHSPRTALLHWPQRLVIGSSCKHVTQDGQSEFSSGPKVGTKKLSRSSSAVRLSW